MKKDQLLIALCILIVSAFFIQPVFAQEETSEEEEDKSGITAATFSGLKLRSIGPAFTSGRIADIAIHPEDDNTWYVAVGSGGVWKTHNSGVTWKPIFDDQASYSTGCVTLDPSNPHTVWVGTGENVGGRHVAYGDGVYVSHDGGSSWKNMGLKKSEHISRIIVHPENSSIIWVAAQGPLWRSGDERGLYKSTDGGGTWKKVLGDSVWTGVTEVVMDPRDPDVLYAATWDRHRTVAAYMGGGPGTGIHRSTDGGETWSKLSKGLPKSNMGKIGLAISPMKPDIVYAAIELDRRSGGVYRSTDRGASWTKMSDAVSGATGPHYYQELYASPHQFDKLYLMDVRIQESSDGGKTFSRLPEGEKHSDNHAIAFRASDPDYLLIGTDGGIYETFDHGGTWRFIDNMPITQYYKVAVDDREPFYHIFGGTQDNGSHGGPSQTDNYHGIRNADWYVTLGADGHQSATEPGNPDIIYAETQEGGLHRVDLTTGEQVYVQPQPAEGEDYERFNWDSPILVSPHSPTRLYFASQRVWRSDNRGDAWTPISGDLTRDEERLALPIMGRVQSWDNAWDLDAMSNYNTITSLAESPLKAGLIYAGTDDGIIQVTDDFGANWRRIDVTQLPGVPERAFVNDIKADLFDTNTVYVALDNHKSGDFKPYLYKSTDRGVSWTSISGDIPDRTLVWRVVQDHERADLLFAATEFGVYFTLSGGSKWYKLKGSPTISFRDLAIQRRENDLVCASFGRSFYVLDDYSPLRAIDEESFGKEAVVFEPGEALLYNRRSVINSSGEIYAAENPPYGAVITYYIPESHQSSQAERRKAEKELNKNKADVPFPGWDALAAEKLEEAPQHFITIRNAMGEVVDKVSAKGSKGIHRVSWDLRQASDRPIPEDGSSSRSSGDYVVPGSYTAQLTVEHNGAVDELTEPVAFDVIRLREGVLEGATDAEILAFQEDLEDLMVRVSAADYMFEKSKTRLKAMEVAFNRAENPSSDIAAQLHSLETDLQEIEFQVSGNPAKREIGEKVNPTIRGRMYTAMRGLRTSYGPTEVHKQSLAIAESQLEELMPLVEDIYENRIPEIEEALRQAGAPWIEGMPLPEGRNE